MSQQINLFNPIFLKQKKHFSAVAMAQALGLILLGSLLLSAFAGYQLRNLGKEVAAIDAQLVLSQSQLDRLKAESGPRTKSKPLEDELQKTQAEVKSLQQVFATLEQGEFGNTKGYSEYLRAFSRQIVDGIWLTGFSLQGAGKEIGLQGRALQPELVPSYINRLKREPVLQGKSFATLEMQSPPADPLANTETAAAKPRTSKGYIEFKLQSAGIKEPVVAQGAAGK